MVGGNHRFIHVKVIFRPFGRGFFCYILPKETNLILRPSVGTCLVELFACVTHVVDVSLMWETRRCVGMFSVLNI